MSSVRDALAAIGSGGFVCVVDGTAERDPGNLVLAAQHATAEAITFMTVKARGQIMLVMSEERCDQLGLESLVRSASDTRYQDAFAMPVDASAGITSGISAEDKARTIAVATSPAASPRDLVRPGHVLPVRARPGGVLQRAGRTEASLDLVTLAGCEAAAVAGDVIDDDGSPMHGTALRRWCETHEIPVVALADVIAFRFQNDPMVEQIVEAKLPTASGTFRAIGFRELHSRRSHLALVKGDLTTDGPVLVRVHRACLRGDIFHAKTCDCRHKLVSAVDTIEAAGRGVLVYLGGENDTYGSGTLDDHHETADPGERWRDYGIGAHILRGLGLTKIAVLTEHPRDLSGLKAFGLEVSDQPRLTP